MGKQMKAVVARKKDNMTLVIPAPVVRLGQPGNTIRGGLHTSKKRKGSRNAKRRKALKEWE